MLAYEIINTYKNRMYLHLIIQFFFSHGFLIFTISLFPYYIRFILICVYTRILYVDIDYFNILWEQYWKQRSLNIDNNSLSNEDWDVLIKSGIFKNVTKLKILGQPPLKVFDEINPNLESLHVEDKNAHPFIHKLLLKNSKLRDLYAKYDNIDLFYKFY